MTTLERIFEKKSSLIFIFVIISHLMLTGCSKPISKETADQIAKTRLEEYCKKEGILITRFPEPNISSDKQHPWIYEYIASGPPKHILLIYIDRDGKTEMHRMIE